MLTTSDVPGSKRKLLCALFGPTSIITFTVCDPTLRKRTCVLLWAATIPAIARNKNATTFVIFRIEPPRGGLWGALDSLHHDSCPPQRALASPGPHAPRIRAPWRESNRPLGVWPPGTLGPPRTPAP